MHGQQTNPADTLATDRRDATACATSRTSADERRRHSLTLATERELQSPLRALRILLEGKRGSETSLTERAFVDRAFVDRALHELLRAERAASDLVQWSSPREVRAVQCTVEEIAESLVRTLDRDERARCHFVVENGDACLVTDGRLVVDSFARTIETLLDTSNDASSEVMVHTHAEDEWVTLSLVEGSAEGIEDIDTERADVHPSLAEALLERDLSSIGGRVSLHKTGGHRCCVVVLPRYERQVKPDAQADDRAFGGAA